MSSSSKHMTFALRTYKVRQRQLSTPGCVGWSDGRTWWVRFTVKEEMGNGGQFMRSQDYFLIILSFDMERDYRERNLAKSGKDEKKF